MSETVPDEAVAGRYSRDVSSQGGDDHYAPAAGNVRDGSSGTLSVIAATATGGRTDRQYLERGGDDAVAYNPASYKDPTTTVDADGRNDREYADPTTGASAITGSTNELFAELQAETGLYHF
jgi:hypothetical protein